MYCSKCGNQVRDNAKFCTHCGSPQAVNVEDEKKYVQSEKQVSSQAENPVQTNKTNKTEKRIKNKKKSKGKIAAIVIVVLEIVMICGVFVFFNSYSPGIKNDDDDDDKGRSEYSLDEANENARLAYFAVSDYFDETYHIEDYIGHGYYSGAIDVKNGTLSDVLENVVDDGYVKIIFLSGDYNDTSFILQWCEDESGDGTIGQYPDPIEEDDKINVEFGTIYDSAEYSNATKDDFLYKTYENGNIEIYEYRGEGKDVVIPEYIDGHKVVAIYEFAFSEYRYYKQPKNDIESLTIPGTIEEIEDGAFTGLHELRSVKISKGVNIIGAGAFSDCESLEKVEIPRSVEEIGEYAFGSCNSLEYIKIPDSVEEIGKSAFKRCDNLKEVDIKDGYRFMFKNIFTYSFIFFEYLFKTIAIGLLVITLIIILIVTIHKKRKAKKSIQTV